MLFLLAAGLTLVFGVMDMINLAHGSLYMVGAFIGAWLVGSHRLVRARPARRRARHRRLRHGARIDAAALAVRARPSLAGARHLRADPDPQRRHAHGLRQRPAAVGARGARRSGRSFCPASPTRRIGSSSSAPASLLAALLYLGVREDAHGRAGARRRLEPRDGDGAWASTSSGSSRLVFGIGAGLCAVAGVLMGPLLAVQVGMGENILILAFVVIVIGGIGSIRGALVGALLVGFVDTFGRTVLQELFRAFLPPQLASAAGPARRLGGDLRLHGGRARHQAAGPVPGARLKTAIVPRFGRIALLLGLAIVLVALPSAAAGDRRRLLRQHGRPHRRLRDRRDQPQPRARLRRHGLVRARRFLRPRRLRHRRDDQRRPSTSAGADLAVTRRP